MDDTHARELFENASKYAKEQAEELCVDFQLYGVSTREDRADAIARLAMVLYHRGAIDACTRIATRIANTHEG